MCMYVEMTLQKMDGDALDHSTCLAVFGQRRQIKETHALDTELFFVGGISQFVIGKVKV